LLGDVRAADLYLACACAERVRGAIEAFDRAHMSRVGMFLSQLRPSPSFVDDVRQVLRERLFVGKDGAAPRIAEYTGRGALASWLRVMALRAAIDLRRAGADAVAAGGDDPERHVQSGAADPELDYIKQRYRGELNEAIRLAVAALADAPRDLFQRHFVDGITLDRLAADLGVHRATVARRVAAARAAVLDEARRLLGARLGARSSEVDSLVHLMRSQLELSLASLKKKTQGEP
jgi:RNA polymerase sigma-70 factor (ECF subfamily)